MLSIASTSKINTTSLLTALEKMPNFAGMQNSFKVRINSTISLCNENSIFHHHFLFSVFLFSLQFAEHILIWLSWLTAPAALKVPAKATSVAVYILWKGSSLPSYYRVPTHEWVLLSSPLEHGWFSTSIATRTGGRCTERLMESGIHLVEPG